MKETKTFNRVTINGTAVTSISDTVEYAVHGYGKDGDAYNYYFSDDNGAVYGNAYGGAYVAPYSVTDKAGNVAINRVPARYAVTFTNEDTGETYYIYATNQAVLFTAIDELTPKTYSPAQRRTTINGYGTTNKP